MSDASDSLHHGRDNKDLVRLKAIAVSEGSKLFVSLVDDEACRGTGVPSLKETLTFFGDYDVEHKAALTDLEKAELERELIAEGILEFHAPGFSAGDFAKFKVTKVKNVFKLNYDVEITFTGITTKSKQSASAVFKGEGDLREGEGAGTWRMASRNTNK